MSHILEHKNQHTVTCETGTCREFLRGRGSNVKKGQYEEKIGQKIGYISLLFYMFARSHLQSSNLHLFDQNFNILY